MNIASFARVYAALWALTLLAAAAVSAHAPLAAAVRAGLGFDLQPRAGTAAEAVDIATTNLRVVGGLVLAAVAVSASPAMRRVADPVVVLVCAANAALVGVAIGAYGGAAIRWLPHLPLEWAALASAVTLYCGARTSPRRPTAVVLHVVVGAVFVVAAAAVEVFLTPQ